MKIGEAQDEEDRDAPDREQHGAEIAGTGRNRVPPAQHQRHHEIVGHHDGERDALDDHHGGAGREAADEGGKGERLRAGRERQRQHVHVAVDRAARERQQAGDRDRQHEQVDQHQVEREQPGGAPDFRLVVVFDHRHVKLARQQQHRRE